MRRILIFGITAGIVGGITATLLTSQRDHLPATMGQTIRPGDFGPDAHPFINTNATIGVERQSPPEGVVPPDLSDLTAEERVNISVYEAANRSVVHVGTAGYRGERFLFVELPSTGEGSGAVIDRLGHIVTNYHVVESGARYRGDAV